MADAKQQRTRKYCFFQRHLNNLTARLHSSTGVLPLIAGSAAGQGLVILVSPLVTRLYTPSHFGALSVFVAILSILGAAGSLRYELAIPLPRDNRTAITVGWCALAASFVSVLLVLLFTLMFGRDAILLLGAPQLGSSLWLLPIGLGILLMYDIGTYWAVRERQFRRIAVTRLRQGMANSAVQVVGGFFGASPLGLLLGHIADRGAGAWTLLRGAWHEVRTVDSTLRLSDLRHVAWRYRKFPLIASIAGITNTAGVSVVPILLAALYGPINAGYYALAQRIIVGPVALIGGAVRTVYTGNTAASVRSSDKGSRILFRKSVTRLALVGAIPFSVLAIWAPALFGVAFGEDWRTAGQFVQVLSFAYFAQFVVVPLSQTLYILERQGTQFLWDLLRLGGAVGTLYGAYVLGYSVVTALTWYTIVMVCCYGALLLLSFLAIGRSDREA